jgi:alkanesulfonate monooxygenase SsuD/methylene tetrahydromethanopterin reductase-like flavin-dependent oxidoreductase (luciferase family)
MKLDLFYEFDAARPWDGPHPHGQRAREKKTYKEAFEQITLADTLGYGTVWCVEHHFRVGRSHMPCSEAVLGALSQVTKNIRLGFGVTLTPFGFIHPARVAEKVATVDLLSGGRVEWGIGRSTPMEQTAFHVDRATVLEDSFEAAEIITGMWREERFSWDSPRFKFPERVVTPKPWQDPHPPAWMATATKSSAVLAGERGLGLLSFAIMQPMAALAELYDAYRAASAHAKPITDVTNKRIGAYTLVHCADSAEEAEANGVWDNVDWWYQNLAEFTLEWEMPNLTKEEQDRIFPFLQSVKSGASPIAQYKASDTLIIGSPEECYYKMVKYVDLGVDNLLCYMQFGNLTNASIQKSLQLIAREVMPEIEKYKAKKAAALEPA